MSLLFSGSDELENFPCGKDEEDYLKENENLRHENKELKKRIERAYEIENEFQNYQNEIRNTKIQLNTLLKERDRLQSIAEFLYQKLLDTTQK